MSRRTEFHCAVCGCDLTDPKNAGDPDAEGNWVCRDATCRYTHDTPMTRDVADEVFP